MKTFNERLMSRLIADETELLPMTGEPKSFLAFWWMGLSVPMKIAAIGLLLGALLIIAVLLAVSVSTA